MGAAAERAEAAGHALLVEGSFCGTLLCIIKHVLCGRFEAQPLPGSKKSEQASKGTRQQRELQAGDASACVWCTGGVLGPMRVEVQTEASLHPGLELGRRAESAELISFYLVSVSSI